MEYLPAFFSGMAVAFVLSAALWGGHIRRHYQSRPPAPETGLFSNPERPPGDLGATWQGDAPPPSTVGLELIVEPDEAARIAQLIEERTPEIIRSLEEALRPQPANDPTAPRGDAS